MDINIPTNTKVAVMEQLIEHYENLSFTAYLCSHIQVKIQEGK